MVTKRKQQGKGKKVEVKGKAPERKVVTVIKQRGEPDEVNVESKGIELQRHFPDKEQKERDERKGEHLEREEIKRVEQPIPRQQPIKPFDGKAPRLSPRTPKLE